ncbi:DNA glycosylase [Wenjunlia vitaminophila]|uniref:DNA-(apurinic or apyrimidinic site) lyase n=1 Tax=Wenjunlia vitaminophila TaxID=76728 RepID=A0A0T6LZD1_WENVI|nr:DNA-formamidopyrimidine glycosylase family protein [Wenjunlia vitaminophila]KRV51483.1 DNA glycosylase [Wenjunlia vitaminophila]
MPEGDTIWLTAQRLREALAERELTTADLRTPALATVDLTGRRVTQVLSRGKHLLIRVDGRVTLHSHLRMDGSWRVQAAGERWRGGPGWQVRAVLGNVRRVAIGYRLPVLDLLPTSEEHRVVGHLGPDLLGADWDAAEAVRRLVADPGRPVGEALLDQRVLAGIGNVYKSELCFLRGITPWTPVADVPEPERLVALAKRTLEANKNRVGHVTTGDTRPGRRHWVYGQAGRPCRRCGTTVVGAEQGPPGQARITFWCLVCQDGPAPAPTRRTPTPPSTY